MTTLSNKGGVLVQSDEMDIVNYLQDAERLRRRRAKIEEIRAKMRAARGEPVEAKEEEEEESESATGQTEQQSSIWSEIVSKTGDVASASGRGLKEAPKQVLNNFKLKNVNTAKPNMNRKIWRPDKSATGKVAVVNHLGTALLVIGIAMDTIEIASAVRKDYKAGTKHNTVHTAAGVAGTWAGALPCAAAGAAIGSAVPVVGSIIGGLVGGIIGSMGGGMLARGIAEAAMPVPDENEPVVDKTPGNCALCSKAFEGFASFYVHFAKEHEPELVGLYGAVAQRIGEERVDIEDTWFVTKAFVKAKDNVDNWQLEDIIAFNDRIMDRVDWEDEKSCNESIQIVCHQNIEKQKDLEKQQQETITRKAQLIFLAMTHCIASWFLSVLSNLQNVLQQVCRSRTGSIRPNGESIDADEDKKVGEKRPERLGPTPVYARFI